ncbi:MAG: spondin domain-containing protein [Cyanobacteria bacterium J06638_38]
MPNTNVTVTIENLASDNGTFITPVWVGFHNGEFDTYDLGRPASPGLESLAEDGATEGISAEFLASGTGNVDGTLLGLEDVGGPIDPGETVSQTFTLDSDDPNSRFFNYASMVIPSNDAFIANGDPEAIPVFDESGNFIGADFIVYGDSVLDAGTEVNNEAESSTAFFGQAAPNTGETEHGVVSIHPGLIEDGRILTEDGSDENAAAAFTGADFSAPGYEVARISIRNDDEPLPPPPDLVEITITVENLSPDNGTPITPLWFGLHDGNFDTYDRGRPASAGLEAIAEDGDASLLGTELLNSGAGFIEGTIPGNEGENLGVIDVGETTSITFTVDRSLPSSRYLNYASMILPSNDGFVANGNPRSHEIFDAQGNFQGGNFIIAGDEVLDAGTELNDEAESSTAFFGQAAPNTGETEGGVVQSHPGFASAGRILSSNDFAGADFTADGYQIARVSISAEGLPIDNDVEVYRFFNTEREVEFYTTSEDERDFIQANLPQYELDGVSFLAASEPPPEENIPDISPVYRFFNRTTGVHLYTVSEAERATVSENSNYAFEGIAYFGYDTSEAGTTPLYRFYNPELDAHFYTPSVEQKDAYLDDPDFQPEGENGIAFYVEPAMEI